MPNYEDFKKYGEMEKQKAESPAPAPEPTAEKAEGGVKKLLGKLKGPDKQ